MDNIWVVILPIAGAIVGYFIKYILDRKAKFAAENSQIKREMYQDHVNFTVGFFENPDTKRSDKTVRKEMYGFYKQMLLYASPKTINACADLMQHFYRQGETGAMDTVITMRRMTKVFKYMRKDIGLSNRGLGSDGIKLMRMMINDFDEKIVAKGEK